MIEDKFGPEQKAKLFDGTRGFDISRFELHGILHGIPIVEIPIEDFDVIWHLGGSNPQLKPAEVHQHDVVPASLARNPFLYSIGANPCNIAVAINRDGIPIVMHSGGGTWGQNAVETISAATEGVVGGGKETMEENKKLYARGSIEEVPPPTEGADFNIILTLKDIELDASHKIPKGLYISYDLRTEAEEKHIIEWVIRNRQINASS